jgi:hypothetical protein
MDAVALDPTALSDLAVILGALHRTREALGVVLRALETAPEDASPQFVEQMKSLRNQLELELERPTATPRKPSAAGKPVAAASRLPMKSYG